jgi:transitional endoplasmic reticulum ATPase
MTQDQTSDRPVWASNLRDKYLAGEASIFVLHGNVFDHVLVGDRALTLRDYLNEHLSQTKGLVMELGWAQGLNIIGGKAKKETSDLSVLPEFKNLEMSASDLVGGGVGDALRKVERSFRKNSVALVIPYAGTLLPAGDPALLSNDERAAYTTIHSWSLDSTLSKRDCVVILIAQSLQEINPDILTSPRVATLEIGLPDEAARARVVRRSAKGLSDTEIALLATHTSGLRAIQVETIVATPAETALDDAARRALIERLLTGKPNAAERAQKMAAITAGKTEEEIIALVDPDAQGSDRPQGAQEEMLRIIHARKREIIEKECSGLISFMESKHGLEAVGGNEKLVAELMEIAKLIKSGNRKLAPMGLLCVGPMGAGKTFVVRALLKEAGLTGVALKNIRSKWNGATEANLERVLATVKAMGPIAVVIDESDRSFGGKDAADTDGGVSARVMARLKEFMSDTDNRGQVLFILMTNRPDRIETDLKRPGRLDRKVPFFYCETAAERCAVLKAILGRGKDGAGIDWTAAEAVCAKMGGYSNADIEAVALLALEFAARRNVALTAELISEAFEDFITSREEDMIQLMELLAAQETSRRSLLPERFAKLGTTELNQMVAILRSKLREAA